MSNLIYLDAEQLTKTVETAVEKTLLKFKQEEAKENKDRLYTINQVAKRLGKSWASIRKYVDNGEIRSTKNGLISEDAINEYLENKA